jgi:hypothetical protein
VIVWIDGAHGVGGTTGALVQELIPNSRVLDAEEVGETLTDTTAAARAAVRCVVSMTSAASCSHVRAASAYGSTYLSRKVDRGRRQSGR